MIYLEEAKVKPVPKKNKKGKPKTMLGRCGALFSRDSQFLLFGRFWLAVFLGLVGIAQCTLSIFLLLAGADPTIVKVAQALAIGAACFGIQPITLRLCHILFKVSTITTLRTMKKSYGALELAVYLIGFWLWPATAALQLYLWFSDTITWQPPQNSGTSGQTLFIVFQVSTVLSLISCVLVWLLVISWPMQYMQFEEKRSMMFSPQTTLRDDDSIFNYTAKWKKGFRDYPTLSPLAKVAFPPSAEKNLYQPNVSVRRDSEPAPFNPDALVAHSTPPRRVPTSSIDYTPTAPLLPRKSVDETREKREQITSSLYSFDDTTPKQEKELSELEASFMNSANRRRRQDVPRVPTIPNMWLQKDSTAAHANAVHPPLPPPHGIHPALRRPSEPAQLMSLQPNEMIQRREMSAPQPQPQSQPFLPSQAPAHLRRPSGPIQPPRAHIAELLRQPSVQQYNSAVPVRKPTLVNISRSPSLINRQNSTMNRVLPSLPSEQQSQPAQAQLETTLEPTTEREEHELVPPPRHPLHTRTASSPPTPLTLEAFPPFDFSLGGLFPEAVTPVTEIRDPLTTPRGDEVFPLSLRKIRSSIVGGTPNTPVELERTSTVAVTREKKPQGYRRARARTGPSQNVPAMPTMSDLTMAKMRAVSGPQGLGTNMVPVPGSQAGGPGVRIRHPGD